MEKMEKKEKKEKKEKRRKREKKKKKKKEKRNPKIPPSKKYTIPSDPIYSASSSIPECILTARPYPSLILPHEQLWKLTYHPNQQVVQFKFSHPAGEALSKAFINQILRWTSEHFSRISKYSRFINDNLRLMSFQPTPTTTPTRYKTPFLTPPLSLHPNHETSANTFPTIIVDYAFSPTSRPSDLLTHWHDLYRIRDLWFSHSKAKTKVVILAMIHPAPSPGDNDDDERVEDQPNNQDNTTNNSNNSRIALTTKKLHARLDVWRYDPSRKMGHLTDEVILFPIPPARDGDDYHRQRKKENITFTIQEIYGEDCDFKFEESGIDEGLTFTLDIQLLRSKMREEWFGHWIWTTPQPRHRMSMFAL
ncbi:hypothetical protein TWF730_006466 [Orbilia blumenaviensis]|uniref:Uncharacterized protein n=1 Tax=Orbilia blumenaviensis TaxID=1796055 RepID=A0AAV9VGN7_9PEZI